VLELATILLLSIHLLAMNIASAGPMIAVWLTWHGSADLPRSSLGRQMMWLSIAGLCIGMHTGGLMLLSSPSEGLALALKRFPANAYWFALAELVFSLMCMSIGVALWNRVSKWWLAILAFATSTNLLYHFPPLMAMIGELANNPNWTDIEIINRPDVLKLMRHSEVLSLTFHFGMSSFAVSAIAVLALITRRSEDDAVAATTARKSALIALVASLSQVPIGVWLLTSLSNTSRSALTGDNLFASMAFIIAILGTIKLLQTLLSIALGQTDAKTLRTAAAHVCVVVLLMTTSLRMSRKSPPLNPPIKTASAEIDRG
jgi:hypothetical protein